MSHGFDMAEFESFLDDISTPFLVNDISTWRRRIQLPFTAVTADGPVILRTEDEVERNFALYVAAFQSLHLTDIVRVPLGFEPTRNGIVIAIYQTELLSHARRVVEPFAASALLHDTPDGWKMSSILNALGHHQWTGRHPNTTGDKT